MPKTTNSVSSFVQLINQCCGFNIKEPFLFRGQPEDLPLLPKIARDEIIKIFSGDLLDMEIDILTQFIKRGMPFLEERQIGLTVWGWLALAQHHGLATRLLDWTTNPLAALWFAVRETPKSNKQQGVVWIFKPKKKYFVVDEQKTDPFTSPNTRIFSPKHLSKRIMAQGGLFTVHRYFEKEKIFIPLERNKIHNDCLTKITISPEYFFKIKYQLARCGVSEALLFQDLDGICKDINMPLYDAKHITDEVENAGQETKEPTIEKAKRDLNELIRQARVNAVKPNSITDELVRRFMSQYSFKV